MDIIGGYHDEELTKEIEVLLDKILTAREAKAQKNDKKFDLAKEKPILLRECARIRDHILIEEAHDAGFDFKGLAVLRSSGIGGTGNFISAYSRDDENDATGADQLQRDALLLIYAYEMDSKNKVVPTADSLHMAT
jgi:hypothetical protein